LPMHQGRPWCIGKGFDEAALLASAAELSVGRFRNVCHHARHAGDPQGYAADEARGVEDRVLELNTGEDGYVFIRGLLDSAGGAVLRTALEPLAVKSGAHDDRHKDRRLADALVELASYGLDSGALPQRASQRAHLQVTASLETLLGSPGAAAAETEFALPISARMVERISCDATVTRVLFGPDSAIVDVGRARRVVPGATRRETGRAATSAVAPHSAGRPASSARASARALGGSGCEASGAASSTPVSRHTAGRGDPGARDEDNSRRWLHHGQR